MVSQQESRKNAEGSKSKGSGCVFHLSRWHRGHLSLPLLPHPLPLRRRHPPWLLTVQGSMPRLLSARREQRTDVRL
jgi:hypothetical protein